MAKEVKKKTDKPKKKKSSGLLKYFVIFLFIGIVVGVFLGYSFYTKIYASNVDLKGRKSTFIYIKTGSDLSDLSEILEKQDILIDAITFEWVCRFKNFTKVNPGKYRILNRMSNSQIINLLRSGKQEKIKFSFYNVRTKKQLASRFSHTLEPDSTTIINLLNNPEFTSKYGFTPETIMAMFIPDSYEFYWNTSVEDFFAEMGKAYKNVWNDERKQKAQAIGLSQTEVAILASIVEHETYRKDERSTVAGVYLNRIRRGILLQADPTVIFAVGDFTINRVRKGHLEIDSPYNTYKYKGLPPGPIAIPSISSIDAVLANERHGYIYFCAKEDFSGYHNFASNFAQHQVFARKFQRALNKRNIQ